MQKQIAENKSICIIVGFFKGATSKMSKAWNTIGYNNPLDFQ